jgi:hypothetical protein
VDITHQASRRSRLGCFQRAMSTSEESVLRRVDVAGAVHGAYASVGQCLPNRSTYNCVFNNVLDRSTWNQVAALLYPNCTTSMEQVTNSLQLLM